jgi:hypothetical protein
MSDGAGPADDPNEYLLGLLPDSKNPEEFTPAAIVKAFDELKRLQDETNQITEDTIDEMLRRFFISQTDWELAYDFNIQAPTLDIIESYAANNKNLVIEGKDITFRNLWLKYTWSSSDTHTGLDLDHWIPYAIDVFVAPPKRVFRRDKSSPKPAGGKGSDADTDSDDDWLVEGEEEDEEGAVLNDMLFSKFFIPEDPANPFLIPEENAGNDSEVGILEAEEGEAGKGEDLTTVADENVLMGLRNRGEFGGFYDELTDAQMIEKQLKQAKEELPEQERILENARQAWTRGELDFDVFDEEEESFEQVKRGIDTLERVAKKFRAADKDQNLQIELDRRYAEANTPEAKLEKATRELAKVNALIEQETSEYQDTLTKLATTPEDDKKTIAKLKRKKSKIQKILGEYQQRKAKTESAITAQKNAIEFKAKNASRPKKRGLFQFLGPGSSADFTTKETPRQLNLSEPPAKRRQAPKKSGNETIIIGDTSSEDEEMQVEEVEIADESEAEEAGSSSSEDEDTGRRESQGNNDSSSDDEDLPDVLGGPAGGSASVDFTSTLARLERLRLQTGL